MIAFTLRGICAGNGSQHSGLPFSTMLWNTGSDTMENGQLFWVHHATHLALHHSAAASAIQVTNMPQVSELHHV